MSMDNNQAKANLMPFCLLKRNEIRDSFPFEFFELTQCVQKSKKFSVNFLPSPFPNGPQYLSSFLLFQYPAQVNSAVFIDLASFDKSWWIGLIGASFSSTYCKPKCHHILYSHSRHLSLGHSKILDLLIF